MEHRRVAHQVLESLLLSFGTATLEEPTDFFQGVGRHGCEAGDPHDGHLSGVTA
jgi:hypothetical protein